jgi:hypothetical protein
MLALARICAGARRRTWLFMRASSEAICDFCCASDQPHLLIERPTPIYL